MTMASANNEDTYSFPMAAPKRIHLRQSVERKVVFSRKWRTRRNNFSKVALQCGWDGDYDCDYYCFVEFYSGHKPLTKQNNR